MLYIISAPSGTGKSSLICALLKNNFRYDTKVSISHTTRAMRPGEIQGEHYYFVSVKTFKQMIVEKAFLEYALVFDNYYGTSRAEVEQVLKTGIDIFLDIDWQGEQQIRKNMMEFRSILILPPSKKELDDRLHKRGQDSEEVIIHRMNKIMSEISNYSEYNYLIINDDFNSALVDVTTIVRAERLRLKYQKFKYDTLINNLLER